jgi:hypothetical protein
MLSWWGGVIALLPIFAEDILKVGPEGLGYLRAAPSIGALVTMIALTRFPPTQHAWRNMLLDRLLRYLLQKLVIMR